MQCRLLLWDFWSGREGFEEGIGATLITNNDVATCEAVRSMSGNLAKQRPPSPGRGSGIDLGWPLSRYDLVLAVIPLAFGVALVAGTVFEVALPTALAVASVLGLGMIVDCIYRNPPVPSSGSESADR